MRGDGEFFEYARARQRWLYQTAVLLCGDPHRAHDLVRSTLTRLLRRWRRVTRADSVDAYARAVLTRRYLAEQRWGRYRRPAAPFEAPFEAPFPAPGDPQPRVVLFAALAELAPRVRAMVVLRYREELSVAEVAELLRCGEGEVARACSRALVQLPRPAPERPAARGAGRVSAPPAGMPGRQPWPELSRRGLPAGHARRPVRHGGARRWPGTAARAR